MDWVFIYAIGYIFAFSLSLTLLIYDDIQEFGELTASDVVENVVAALIVGIFSWYFVIGRLIVEFGRSSIGKTKIWRNK